MDISKFDFKEALSRPLLRMIFGNAAKLANTNIAPFFQRAAQRGGMAAKVIHKMFDNFLPPHNHLK